jgi:cellulose synthase/poly-beta-1,6-N-acetylglucosamine synthase-like glycosyltransferase
MWSNEMIIDKKTSITLAIMFLSIFIILFGISVLLHEYVSIAVALLTGAAYLSYLLIMSRKKNKSGARINKKSYEAPFIIFCLLAVPILIPAYVAIFYLKEVNMAVIYAIVISIGITQTSITTIFSIPLAIKDKAFDIRSDKSLLSYFPLVTIIVPAYNEELNIGFTIESLIQSRYPNKQIIVVDDGSTDQTYAVASRALRDFRAERYLVLRKENGGKASALNYGISYAKGQIVVMVDADSIVQRNALDRLVKMLQQPNISAVAGNTKILNRVNFLTNCQQLEYIVGINLVRRSLSFFGVVMVVPGALGAFKIKKIVERGKYDRNTITEDFDVTIKILKGGGQIRESDSITYTEAPRNLKNLYKQRIRWYRGTLQTLIKHKNILKTSRYGMLSRFGYPITLLMFITIPILNMMITASIILALIEGMWLFSVLSFVIFTSLQTLVSLIAIILDNEDWKLALYSPFMLIGYRQFLDYLYIKSMFDVLLAKKPLIWTTVMRVKHIGTTIKTKK